MHWISHHQANGTDPLMQSTLLASSYTKPRFTSDSMRWAVTGPIAPGPKFVDQHPG